MAASKTNNAVLLSYFIYFLTENTIENISLPEHPAHSSLTLLYPRTCCRGNAFPSALCFFLSSFCAVKRITVTCYYCQTETGTVWQLELEVGVEARTGGGLGADAAACLVLSGHWPNALLAGKCATIDNRNRRQTAMMPPQIAAAKN